jgi:hypothetical protein
MLNNRLYGLNRRVVVQALDIALQQGFLTLR